MAESNAERKENKPCEGKEARRGQPEGPSGPLPAGRSLGPARTRDLLGPLATRAVEVTEVTEVTETVVTEAVEVGPVQPGSQPALASPGPLDTTRSWLEGMEELQASQGPLAPDVTVAVAQLREQKLLRRLLEERALQVELRLQEAQSPGQLRARWDGLVQRAEARWGLLEQLVPAARSFEVAHSALLALLTPGEQLLAELWQDQLGPEGCKGAVQRLQGVCEGAAARTEGLERALEAGQRLAELLAAVFRKEVELLGGCWSEAQKQDTRLKAIRGPVELAASEEGLQPEGSWAQALQVFPWELWGEWTLSASLLWREPALPGRATGRGTCHLGLLLEPQGCRAMASSSTTERPRVLEGTVMLAAPRFAEELLTLPTRLSQAEPHGPKPGPVARGCGRHSHLLDQAGVVMMALLPGVLRPPSLHQDSECPSDLQVVQARGWGLEEWPVALGAAGLKPWTRAPGKALTLRDPGQGQPEDLRSRTVTRASLGGLLEDLSWRPPQGVGATRRGAGGTRTSGHDVGRGSHAQPPTSCSEELARTRVSWLGGHAACNGLATGSTSPPPSRTLWTVASGPVSRGALMVRVGGGWVALDEYLVKYDPGRDRLEVCWDQRPHLFHAQG
ncbi:Microtubule-actin cross-linking factor 1; isoforms 1/2/3/5 [Camelus dromedarius]|uniref:Microtubule-actin cross-linking factor 1 n=1 Tax=Camelus dromedarius TaxID=9838 RepID=A0A5N4CGH0_CAMDR|nr:Microtubule-actin cross-linking factor 1; isoforms 1/2/3/5 [Camelus dromedarius]